MAPNTKPRSPCSLCPRKCGERGMEAFCDAPELPMIARADLHFFEEPPISGTKGSGTVFFCGCNLHCVFCQNGEISQIGKFGKIYTIEDLTAAIKTLEDRGAHNINFVTPSHYAARIGEVLSRYRPSVPVIYNSSGYDSLVSLKLLKDYVDIYLPDLKFFDAALSLRYCGAPDYFDVASKAVLTMRSFQPRDIFDADGLMKKGVLIRHLVMPSLTGDSIKILDFIKQNLDKTSIALMSQYLPCHHAADYPEINRKLTTFEYNKVLKYAETLGLKGYMQGRSSAEKAYIPTWDKNETP